MFIDVWPDNWGHITLFNSLATQWRLGPNGKPTGLDYTAVMGALDDLAGRRMRRKARGEFFCDLQFMESEALREIHDIE